MELRIIVDAIVRPTTSRITTFLVPSTTLRRTAQGHICSRFGGNGSLGRQFSSTTSRNVDWSPVTTPAPPPRSESSSSSTSTSPKDADVSDLVGALGWAARKPARAPKPYEDVKEDNERRFNRGNTANDLLKEFNKAPGIMAERYRVLDNVGPAPSKFSLDDMRMDVKGTSLELVGSFVDSQKMYDSPKRALMKLGPSTGRMVEIGGPNIGIERGFQLLASSCARNRVRVDSVRQKFHERPGSKRKRLLSERWRKKFRAGFHEAVRRTRELQRQGW